MHGLIFVTWEKYLAERFGEEFLHIYRKTIGETPATAPLASRVYNDDTLLAGVHAASKLTGLTTATLLREAGRYYLMNGLTTHRCAYILTQVRSARELLLAMRGAHLQMRRTPDKLIPPVFGYEMISTNPNELVLIYDSPRHMCSMLWGAIEGAAERYGERVRITERTCMKQGAAACRFELCFFPPAHAPALRIDSPQQMARRRTQQQLANVVLATLPTSNGITLLELRALLQLRSVSASHTRPIVLLEALNHLQHAGLVSSTANQPGDDLSQRRYWRSPTAGVPLPAPHGHP